MLKSTFVPASGGLRHRIVVLQSGHTTSVVILAKSAAARAHHSIQSSTPLEVVRCASSDPTCSGTRSRSVQSTTVAVSTGEVEQVSARANVFHRMRTACRDCSTGPLSTEPQPGLLTLVKRRGRRPKCGELSSIIKLPPLSLLECRAEIATL